jgi:hypothetical protein
MLLSSDTSRQRLWHFLMAGPLEEHRRWELHAIHGSVYWHAQSALLVGMCRHGGGQVFVTSELRVSWQTTCISVACTVVARTHCGACEADKQSFISDWNIQLLVFLMESHCFLWGSKWIFICRVACCCLQSGTAPNPLFSATFARLPCFFWPLLGPVPLIIFNEFLGAFAKSRRATVSFVMSVRPSAWNNSAPT